MSDARGSRKTRLVRIVGLSLLLAPAAAKPEAPFHLELKGAPPHDPSRAPSRGAPERRNRAPAAGQRVIA